MVFTLNFHLKIKTTSDFDDISGSMEEEGCKEVHLHPLAFFFFLNEKQGMIKKSILFRILFELIINYLVQ